MEANFKPPYMRNGPLLTLEDGHYASIMEIKGLDFPISIVMSATDLTAEDGIHRHMQAERLVKAWNLHDPLVHAITMIRDADNDAAGDGLQRIPAAARAYIDEVLTAAGAA